MNLQEAITTYRTADDLGFDGQSCYAITPRLLHPSRFSLSRDQLELVEALDQGFLSIAPTETPITVYRGAHISFVQTVKSSAYPAYISTSTDVLEAARFLKDHSEGSALLKIVCPVGSRLMSISGVDLATLESGEKLLPRGCRFAVSDWDITTESEEIQIALALAPPGSCHTLTLLP